MWNLDLTEHTAFNQATRPLYETYFPAPASGDTDISLEENAYLREIRHAWDKEYSGADYVKLLHTYPNHRTLPEPDKTRFFQAIAEVIDRTGGAVQRKYETLLLLARTK